VAETDDILEQAGRDLLAAVEVAIGPWVHGAVASRLGRTPDDGIRAQTEEAAREATTDIGARLAELLALDIDDQWTNPLAILRTVTTYPTRVLTAAGVPPAERDREAVRLHPDDVYDLAPGSFADLGPGVHEPGLVWGAAKAHVHLQRRRHEEVA
jgi:hypothetical protein